MRAWSNAPPSASNSALKLEEHWLPRKRKVKEVEQEEQRTKAAPPPGPNAPSTEPSVQMVRSAGGREERWETAAKRRRNGGSERAHGCWPRERETSMVGTSEGENGGQRTKVSLCADGGGVRGWEKQKSRQEDLFNLLLTGSEAKEARGKDEAGRRSARS